MNPSYLTLLEEGYSLVTPTRRMSRALSRQYADERLHRGDEAWESADILPWQSWLNRFWEQSSIEFRDIPVHLSGLQQQNIWLQIINQSSFAEHILQANTVARQALQAWDLSHQWQIPPFANGVYINHDVRAFQVWANEYQSRLHDEHWIDDACLPQRLLQWLQEEKPALSLKVALVGHDSLLPQQHALLNALAERGAEVEFQPLIARNEKVQSSGFTDSEEEIRAAAEWAAKLLETEADAHIGIVVPELQAKRRTLVDTFDDCLAAGDILRAEEPAARAYSISLGQPLSSYPLIASALSLLQLANGPIEFSNISRVLRSVYIRDGLQRDGQRAALEARLREHGETMISLHALQSLSRKPEAEQQDDDNFLHAVTAMMELVNRQSATQGLQQWVSVFTEILVLFQWPGERSLNSAEYQVLEAWNNALSQLVGLQLVYSKVGYAKAFSMLGQLCRSTSFQPETSEAGIQILGHAGAAGMQFDHLWVLGLHEEAWPGSIYPNPFIPLALQKEHGMPAASAENQLAYARDISERLRNSATHIVFSYPRSEGERELNPSALIVPYLDAQVSPVSTIPSSYARQIFESRILDQFEDERGPALDRGVHSGGGTALFKDQAACAFRAFARHRLQARSLVNVDIGLNPMERGLLLHDVMQELWGRIRDFTHLLSLQGEAEAELSAASIQKVLARWQAKKPDTLGKSFRTIEQQRLQAIVGEWLQVERQRQDFTVIAREQELLLELGEIEIRTRIDRIDEIAGSKRIIIDYKTGDSSTGAWFDERPEEPQLPIYAISSKDSIVAISFASLKPGKCRFIGVSAEENTLPAVKSLSEARPLEEDIDWNALLGYWRTILLKLARDFREGDARVNPKNSNTCQYCDLSLLCRVDELNSRERDKAG